MIVSEDDVIRSILDLWDATDLELPSRQRELIASAGETGFALADSVIRKINSAIAASEPTEEASRLLSEIDEFYVRRVEWSRSSEKPQPRSQSPRSRFVEVVQLISPLVYFDEIIAMQSFDDDFLSRMQLAFLSRLDVPRSVQEAERVYTRVLQLPKRFEQRGAMGMLSSLQPFQAQMFFAHLLMREPEPQSELWRYLKQCLEKCPDYLVNVPDRPGSLEYSSRPAFWMGCIDDAVFQEILIQRGSKAVRDSVNRHREYLRKIEASALVVRSELAEPPRPLGERVSAEQEELAALLTALEGQALHDLPELADEFEPSVKDDQLEKLNRALEPLRLTEDVEVLYKWRNGFRSDICFFGFPDFNPIEFAFHEYKQLAEVLDETWSRAWFPLCGRGRSFRLTLLSEKYAPSTPVFRYDIEDGELQLEFESLESMVRTYKDAYEARISVYDDSVERFRFSEKRLEELRLEINPRAYSYPSNQRSKYDVWDPSGWPPMWRRYKVQA